MEDANVISEKERTFGHGIVSWEIKNYGLVLWQNVFQVETPEFFIRGPESRRTKWKLILKTTLEEIEFSKSHSEGANPKPADFSEAEVAENYLESSDLVLCLQRCESDNEPETVRVDWKVYCLGVDGKKSVVEEGDHYFDGESKHSLYLGTIFDTERGIIFNAGVMTLICQMIVIDRYYWAKFDISDDIDLCALSEDLHWVFTEKKQCDQEIRTINKSMHTHKALLYVRSKFFQIMLNQNDSRALDLSGIESDAAMRVLEYMYSGDICDILERPLVSVYRCLVLMNLTDLMAHYDPEQVKIKTNIDVKKLTYVWVIDNFGEKENCFSSPILSNNETDAAWQINLYPRGFDGKSEYTAISVEYIEGQLADNLNIQCAIVDDSKESQYWKTLQKSTKTMFTDGKFMKRDLLLKKADDVLKLGLKVRMCSIDQQFSLQIKNSRYVAFSNEMSLKKLSEDLSTLRDSKKYADLTIEVGSELVIAHKFIIHARSCYLSSILDEINDNVLFLPYVKSETFKIALDYMYCAKLNVKDVKLLLDLYKFADEYSVSRLKNKCARILSSSLTIDTVCEVLNLADDYKDYFLLEVALEFARVNIEAISKLEAWKKLMTEKSDLCSEVILSSKEARGEKILEVAIDDTAENNVIEIVEASKTGEEIVGEIENCPVILHNEKLEVIARTPYIAEIKRVKQREPLHRRRIYLCPPAAITTTVQIDPEKDSGAGIIGTQEQTDDSNASRTLVVHGKTIVIGGARPKEKRGNKTAKSGVVAAEISCPRKENGSKDSGNVKAQTDPSSDSNTVVKSSTKSCLEDSSASETLQACGGVADQCLSSSEVTDTKDEIKTHGDSSGNLETDLQTNKIDAPQEGLSLLAEVASKEKSEDSSSADKRATKHSSPSKKSKHSSPSKKSKAKSSSKSN